MDKRVASYIKAEYTKVELLKKTEQGSIWLAKDGTGQIVVVKHLSATGLPIRKLKEIAHPLWPRILFTAEEDDTTWVVEEYVSGNTLSAEIEAGRRFSPAEVKNIMLQLLDGMAAFHQAGIIHRDIKPSNIILQGEQQARLLDFGVAREMHRENSPDTRAFGTSGYAPPEQYGFGQTDARSDIYALGVTMKELLEEGNHGWLTAVLGKCTALDPKDRYQNADELKAALLRPSYRRISRMAALFLIACAMLGIGYWVQQNKPPLESHEEQRTDAPSQIETPLEEPNPANAPASPNASSMEESSSIQENAPIIPQENVFSLDSPAPFGLDSSSVHTIPQPSPEVAKETKKLAAEDIGLSLAVGNENLGAGGKYNITVPKAEWEAWETAGTTPMMTKYFPSDWEIVLTIENRSNVSIEKCTLQAAVEDGKLESHDTYVAPGGSAQIAVPLSGSRLQRSDKYIWLSFSSDTPHLKSSSFSYYVWIKPETD